MVHVKLMWSDVLSRMLGCLLNSPRDNCILMLNLLFMYLYGKVIYVLCRRRYNHTLSEGIHITKHYKITFLHCSIDNGFKYVEHYTACIHKRYY